MIAIEPEMRCVYNTMHACPTIWIKMNEKDFWAFVFICYKKEFVGPFYCRHVVSLPAAQYENAHIIYMYIYLFIWGGFVHG